MKKRITQTQARSVADFRTGEVVAEETDVTFYIDAETTYVKMYATAACVLGEVPIAERETLRLIAMRLDYDGKVFISKSIQTELCDALHVTPKTLSNRIAYLLKRGMLHRVRYKEYLVNPDYYARGDWTNVKKLKKDFARFLR